MNNQKFKQIERKLIIKNVDTIVKFTTFYLFMKVLNKTLGNNRFLCSVVPLTSRTSYLLLLHPFPY